MSLRRARHVSPTEMTDSKRRLTDPNEKWTDPNELWPDLWTNPNNKLTNLDEFSSLFKWLCNLCETQAPSSNILSLLLEFPIRDLADAILKNSESGGFFEMAKELLLKLVEDRPRVSGDEFSTLACQVWLNPELVHGLRSVMEKDSDMVGLITSYARQEYLPTARMAQMEADPCFKPCLMAIESASRNVILTVFFCLLIGYWSDKGQFAELDKRMGKDLFGRRMEMIAKSEAMRIACAGKEDKIEDLSFDIKDISDVKDLEPLRQLLVSRYGGGGGGDIDVEDILETVNDSYPTKKIYLIF